ncbi:MAG TPA: hypothetical protein VHB79_35550 [Polyangiaceae bacterium]|nr:hypothetical protein [Polyangiaceae bacterium]
MGAAGSQSSGAGGAGGAGGGHAGVNTGPATNGGSGTNTNGGTSAGTSSAFWEEFDIGNNGDQKRLFIVTDDVWVRSDNAPISRETADFISYDQGKQWQALHSGFTNPLYQEGTFGVLGVDREGTLLARWISPGSTCSQGCLPTTPGQAGTTYLLSLDITTKSWALGSPFPEGDFSSIRYLASSTTSSWLFDSGGKEQLRYDGSGQWQVLSPPSELYGPIAVSPAGTRYAYGLVEYATAKDSLALLRSAEGASAWEALPDCPATLTELTAVDDQNLYGVSRSGFYHFDTGANAWETRTPPITLAENEHLYVSGRTSKEGHVIVTLGGSIYDSATDTSKTRLLTFLSVDGGKTWAEHSLPKPTVAFSALAFDAQGRAYLMGRPEVGEHYRVWRSPSSSQW